LGTFTCLLAAASSGSSDTEVYTFCIYSINDVQPDIDKKVITAKKLYLWCKKIWERANLTTKRRQRDPQKNPNLNRQILYSLYSLMNMSMRSCRELIGKYGYMIILILMSCTGTDL